MTMKGAKRRAAKILLINIHDIRHISYSIAEQLPIGRLREQKSYSELGHAFSKVTPWIACRTIDTYH